MIKVPNQKMSSRLSKQKLRGGYNTPQPIADFLTSWAIRSSSDLVLEPSYGDGNILVSAASRLIQLGAPLESVHKQLHGAELDPHASVQAIERLKSLGLATGISSLISGRDFFDYCEADLMEHAALTLTIPEHRRFDAVIGNPPFIRYQNFPEAHRQLAFQLMRLAGLRPSRLTNAWVPFLIVGSLLLKAEGRLAMVVPAELFQVGYAEEVRKFLSDYFDRIVLITFRELVFDGILQEVVLVLAERNGSDQQGIRSLEVQDMRMLASLDKMDLSAAEIKPMDHSTEKWTQYFLRAQDIQLLRSLRTNPNLTVTGKIFDVDVGVVTGRNSFFILTAGQAKKLDLNDELLNPMVTRSAHLRGLVFTEDDWRANKDLGYPAYLLRLPSKPIEELPLPVQRYIASGEEREFNRGYKCRIRDPWFVVPSVWIPDAFMLRQVHAYPKMVVNTTVATCTDTIHRMRLKTAVDRTNLPQIAAAFLNSLTLAFSEVTGRSYGGGVLTFEPSEAEKLPIPLIGHEHLDANHVDSLVREDKLLAVLDITDHILLVDGLGLTPGEVRTLRSIWVTLRDRRMSRKRKGSI